MPFVIPCQEATEVSVAPTASVASVGSIRVASLIDPENIERIQKATMAAILATLPTVRGYVHDELAPQTFQLSARYCKERTELAHQYAQHRLVEASTRYYAFMQALRPLDEEVKPVCHELYKAQLDAFIASRRAEQALKFYDNLVLRQEAFYIA